MLLVISSLKLVCEIALLAMAGQGVLHLLAGAQREVNVFYGLLRGVTWPLTRAVKRCLPAAKAERWAPWITFVALSLAWLGATVAKIHHCLSVNFIGCR